MRCWEVARTSLVPDTANNLRSADRTVTFCTPKCEIEVQNHHTPYPEAYLEVVFRRAKLECARTCLV